ncbi:MAG TPA: glycosyltransferase [Bryobacteraceae bacterium]|jgi:GT2 family glycosyltransferase
MAKIEPRSRAKTEAAPEPKPQPKIEPAEPQPPRVTALIVSYNSVAALRRSVQAVDATPGVEVLVVDLGSQDGSARIDAEYPGITVLRLPKHFGATKAMNIATRTSGADYILYLDPHAVVEPSTALGLADILDANADVIAACPLFKSAEDGTLCPQVYKLPDSAALAAAAESGSLPVAMPPSLSDELVPVEFASRNALIVRKDFIRGMNYFDERYGHAWGDLELAWQIQNAQRKTVIATRLGAVWHTPEPAQIGSTTIADRYNGAWGYVSKHFGFVSGIGFLLGAIFKALFSFRFGLLGGLLSGQKIDGTQSSL